MRIACIGRDKSGFVRDRESAWSDDRCVDVADLWRRSAIASKIANRRRFASLGIMVVMIDVCSSVHPEKKGWRNDSSRGGSGFSVPRLVSKLYQGIREERDRDRNRRSTTMAKS
ncbi:hypothetical protein HPP92_005931 [Vanilla planifolia]|uniref:Uncharacterized protein n=1 Tax=Vanilla planifolia TaxID=51239 RepID=A0A835RJX3_VANPL|nr:hypothetical protein HPP92_006212 [Vanilla planifolia]KAG0494937.1 hypothetical protein HPP92_005931 [Vanilla planifolia]